jgi:hypothetical protein
MKLPMFVWTWSIAPNWLLTGLISYYEFENNVLDSHWSNNGTDNGTSDIAGIILRWRNFDWINDYINTNFSTTSNSFSISAWFKSTSTSDWDIVWKYKWLSNERAFIWRLQSDGKIHMYITSNWTSITQDFVTTNTCNDWNWHNVVFINQWAWVWPMQVWVDWVNQTWTLTWSDSNVFSSTLNWGLWIIDVTTPTTFFAWDYDEVWFWIWTILTPSQIESIYNSGNGLQYNQFN